MTPMLPPALADFWDMSGDTRDEVLLDGIVAAHAFHYEHNTAYRSTVAARGVGPSVGPSELPRLLRSTSQGFRSYVDVLGSPFPQDRPRTFATWLADMVSVDPHPERHRFHDRYRSLERLLRAIERDCSDRGLQMLISDGGSGRPAIIPRDNRATGLAAESFHLSLERFLAVGPDHTAVFLTHKRTRVALFRMTRFGLRRAGVLSENIHFAAPLADHPDRERVRSGLTYRDGLRGTLERHVSHPLLVRIQDRLMDGQMVESALKRLIPASAHEDKVLLVGALPQLHKLASFLLESGKTVPLAPGSLLITGGDATPGEEAVAPLELHDQVHVAMREDLRRAFPLTTGGPAPVRELFSAVEGGWVAVQCSHGNHHIPPWVYAVTVDDQEKFHSESRSTGLLAFFDPYGGGDLFPAFFRTTDRVTLVRDEACPCGQPGGYVEEDSIQREASLGVAG